MKNTKMASFDFIDAAAKGYEITWRDRAYLARVAVPVLFVKVACFLAIFVLGAQEHFLRQGLISMPGFVVEAIFVAGLIRYVLYREPIFIWGRAVPMPETDDKPYPYHGAMSRNRCIQAGIATYLLLKVILGGFSAVVLDNYSPLTPTDGAPTEGEAEVSLLYSLIDSFVMFGAIVLFVWSFRLLWIYIPISMGVSFSDYLKKMTGMKSSLYMMATWFICFLPLIILFVSVIQLFTGLMLEGSFTFIFVKAILEGLAEIILICVPVIAMTHGVAQIFFGKVR